jgi:hypothetical protein
LIGHLLLVVAAAYLLAGIPVAVFALLGRLSPSYSYPREALIRYWSWFALIIVVAALLHHHL